MQCGVKRKHCPSLEHINLERQQQSLFDLSILKLQQEQLRHGVEPRLLRFVLINNALRALQGHMFLFGDEDEFSFDSSSDRCGDGGGGGGGGGASESFLSNTFRDGGLPTTPASPPTPVKVIKLEATLSDQSPLVASTPFQSFVVDSRCATSDDERERVECANLPPCERLESIVACESTSEGKESTVRDVLSVTMTTVEERPANFSTTTVADDSPCACGKVSLGKRKREEGVDKQENLVSSNGRLCSCVGEQTAEGDCVRSMRVGEEEETIEKECNCIVSKKVCSRPTALSINGTKRINGMNGLTSVYTVLGLDQIAQPTSCSSSAQSPPCSPEDTDEESSTTPSPIDFTKVDPTLYDYDTKAPLFITAQDPPTATPPDSNGHVDDIRDVHDGIDGSTPVSMRPDSSSAAPSSSSLPCVSETAPSSTDDASCSSSESVTSPTLAITATSTTFSLPSSSEYPLISSSNHDCSVSESLSTSAIESNLIIADHSDVGKRSSSLSPSSCSLEGLVSAQNGNLVHGDSERTENEASISNGINGGVPSSPEGAENDFLEDIVSLLMT